MDLIQINAIANGRAHLTLTGDAWDIAYLANDESRYVTGIELVVDGGITLKYV